jgi:acetoacetate decarboxylase
MLVARVSDRRDTCCGGAVLPDTFGQGLLQPVLRIPNNYIVMLPFRTDAAALQALLPDGLTVAAEPVVTFRFRRAQGIEWSDSTSHLLGATATVEAQRSTGPPRTGMHFIVCWEDDPMAVLLGREVAGTVKLPGEITLDRDRADGDSCLLHYRGRPLVQIDSVLGRRLEDDELGRYREQRRHGCTIGFKSLPTVDGSDSSERHATVIPTVTEITSAWHVQGTVTLFETTPATARWHHRAVAALRSLPLHEPLAGLATLGENTLLLSDAERLV